MLKNYPAPDPPELSGEECEIVQLVARDFWSWQIAALLEIEEEALTGRIHAILSKLRLRGRYELWQYAHSRSRVAALSR